METILRVNPPTRLSICQIAIFKIQMREIQQNLASRLRLQISQEAKVGLLEIMSECFTELHSFIHIFYVAAWTVEKKMALFFAH